MTIAIPTPAQRIPTLLLTPVCPECGQDIELAHIEPAAPGHELRTFECAQCGFSKSVDFQIKHHETHRPL
jgi:hypothetical protein